MLAAIRPHLPPPTPTRRGWSAGAGWSPRSPAACRSAPCSTPPSPSPAGVDGLLLRPHRLGERRRAPPRRHRSRHPGSSGRPDRARCPTASPPGSSRRMPRFSSTASCRRRASDEDVASVRLPSRRSTGAGSRRPRTRGWNLGALAFWRRLRDAGDLDLRLRVALPMDHGLAIAGLVRSPRRVRRPPLEGLRVGDRLAGGILKGLGRGSSRQGPPRC